MLAQSEIDSLTAYLCKLFNCRELMVIQHPEEDTHALVAIGQEFFARIERDDEEGELCYNFSKELPDQPHEEMNAHIKTIFNCTTVEIRRRPNKTDSAEVYKGEEFLGVVYDDDQEEAGHQIFNMAILDIDLVED